MPLNVNRRLSPFGISVFTEFTGLARAHNAINLSQGYPDFDGPDLVKQVAVDKIWHGHNQYAPSPGMPVLRQAVADKARRFHGLEVDPETEVTVFAGATEAIFSSLMGICEPDSEVILFEPCYDSYPPSVIMAGATPRYVTLRFPDYAIDADELRAAFGARTRAIVVNTPMNPCGKVFSHAELTLIAELCQEHDVIAITDEVYEHLCYDDAQHLPLISLPGMRERTVAISSTAKTFSMTGWKIGYAIAGAELSRALVSAHQWITFCAPPPLQEAMAAGLAMDDNYYQELHAGYAQRRRLLCDRLRALGFALKDPPGTYYIAAGIGELGFDDDYAFCRAIPEQLGVAMIPVSAFYQDRRAGRQVVRVAFCKSDEILEEACQRLAGVHRLQLK